MKSPSAGGGWPSIWYTISKARQSGGVVRMIRALRSRNACKTCALGMGGQLGGMTNERGHFPEVCKKSVQAMAADLQGRIKPGFFDEFSFDHLARFTPRELEHAGRITQPLFAAPGDRSYRAVPWEHAMEVAVQGLKQSHPDETFFYFSGRSSNEAGFLLQLFARLYGTNNVNNCSYFCHQASGVGLKSAIGSSTGTIVLEDLEKSDLVFVIGANPASNHPRLMATLMRLKRRGGKVIVINPLKELGLVRFKVPSDARSLLFGTDIADEYLQPHIGADNHLLTGIAKAVLELGAAEGPFIHQHTEGWDALQQAIRAEPWPRIEQRSGVPIADIKRVAALYARANNAVFTWTMGITHHAHGVQNVQAITNLALMRAMIGRPGAGLLPLRGHSNVQGIGSMGAVPELKGPMLDLMQSRLGVRFPTTPGLDTLACVDRAGSGGIRAAWHLGGNLFGSCPDADAARRALANIDLTVFLSTTLNTGHIHGRGKSSLILPVRARDEESQPTTQESMFNFVRLSDGGPARFDGPRAEVEIIAHVARRVLESDAPIDFADMERHASIRAAISKVVPGYEKLADIDNSKREFQIDGRTIHQPKFNTPSGRASFTVCSLPDPAPLGESELRLMTIRSEGQFNTVVYEEHDAYRAQERRDVILMNAADIARLGLKPDQPVDVVSTAGRMGGILVREADIRAGNAAMYYPEANVLVPARADPASRTPAFKSITVRIERRVALGVRGNHP